MADIFISYARVDIELTERLARVLQDEGHSVWWDTQLEVGEKWRKRIEAELHAARAVIVLWSKTSVESDYVVDEAAVGRSRGCLVPISIDGTQPPMGFRGLQTAFLGPWKGDGEDSTIRGVCTKVAAFVNGKALQRRSTKNPKPERQHPRWLGVGVGGGLLLGGGLLANVLFRNCQEEPSKLSTTPQLQASAGGSRTSSLRPLPSSAAVAASPPAQFIRERPGQVPHAGVDACAYIGWLGFACLDAIKAERDPAKRQYMRRLSDADARLAKDNTNRGVSEGIPHPEIQLNCKDSGPCGPSEGMPCLVKAEVAENEVEAKAAHARACVCDPAGAQIPIMGGRRACDGATPVERGGELTIDEALDIRACGECDPKIGASACMRELERLRPRSPLVAEFLQQTHVPRCQQRNPPGEWAPMTNFSAGYQVLDEGRLFEAIEEHESGYSRPAEDKQHWRPLR